MGRLTGERGRPPKPLEERRGRPVSIRLTPAEEDALARAALQARVSISEFVRARLGFSVVEKIQGAS